MTTAIDDQIVSNDDIVIGEDIRGNVLTQRTLSERLVSLAVTDIKNDSDVEWLANILSDGFRGYERMSPGELWSEWKEEEEAFFSKFDADRLYLALDKNDPLSTKTG
jgi:hypothetical protein